MSIFRSNRASGSTNVRRNQFMVTGTVVMVGLGLLFVSTADSASAAFSRDGSFDRDRATTSSSVAQRATTTTVAARSAGQTSAAPTTTAPQPKPLTRDCDRSRLQEHNGFQNGSRCVTTEFGEVSESDRNPQLLITESPNRVKVNQAFSIEVSSRNLIRDRFLGAAVGGYYLEASTLANGLQRGHIHTACRMLQSDDVAPNPDPVPAFFKATEDGKGGTSPDKVTIEVTGMPSAGLAQCAVWAGDGSHRVPMMERANQTPAFDIVRIRVTQ